MSEEKPAAIYDESKITTLSSLEHIRLRPGMYIGRLGNGSHQHDGIYILIKEIIDNANDEHIMGYGSKVDITLDHQRVRVRDYGRGIPFGKMVDCVSIINTGAKYNDDVFQFSIGLNGVGTKAVNALSTEFKVTSFREGQSVSAYFQRGVLIKEDPITETQEKNGTAVEFVADSELFVDYQYRHDFIRNMLWNYAYLNSSLTLNFNAEKFRAKEGLLEMIRKKVGEKGLYDVIHHKGEHIEFSFTHTDEYGETHYSFVNGHYTSDGGSHLSAFREGILKGMNEYFKSSYQGSDVRDGIVTAISIKVKEPVFESQTKNKLGNSDIRGWIVNATREAIVDYLYKNTNVADRIKSKLQMNEKLRKELADVKKAVKSRNKKSSLNISSLRDCKRHYSDGPGLGEDTMIFLTEGQSAGGSMISSRDVHTQAIFCMRGKPLNCWNLKREAIYKNEEFYNIMKTLGLEESIEGLRYNKVVIATDADVDGMHIRNLLLTFFLHFFEELVIRGHLFILETPLFRVRNSKETRYCYSEEEKDDAVVALKRGKHFEITRFKGLGEISPKEFGMFIREDMKITPVIIEELYEVSNMLNFYMGKNTEQRKRYIMENLV